MSITGVIGFFGPTMFSLRFLPAIGGTLAIPAVYLLAREIAGKRIALTAATLLAFAHAHIHFSRTAAVAYIYGTWFIPLELYFLLSGLKNRSAWKAAIGGCLLAFHFSIYISAHRGGVILSTSVVFLLFRVDKAMEGNNGFLGGFASPSF
jgi:asparagine N-glycosylation enzyme membrane subunit Stt3